MTTSIHTKKYLVVLSTAVAAVLTLASGLVQGRLSNRWGPPLDMTPVVAQLQTLPETFGPWRLRQKNEMEEKILEVLECSGYVAREYVNDQTGEAVNLTVILGPPGPTSAHTPEICYASTDFNLVGQSEILTIGDEGDAFWRVEVEAKDPLAAAPRQRVCYGWSTGGAWSANNRPRLAFAGSPYLYKIQVTGRPPAGADQEKNDPCRDFLEDFVPAARGCLVDPDGE